MKRFEYDITKHTGDYLKQIVYFCNSDGECSSDTVPDKDINALKLLINERGSSGWELI